VPTVILLSWLSACTPDVRAIVDPARPTHFFDVPFPSDDLLGADGSPDLTGFPLSEADIAAGIEAGWIDRITRTTEGFSNQGAAYFRFDGPLDLPSSTPGLPSDPVVLVDVATLELVPLELRFVEDPAGDPHYGPNTLAVAPTLARPVRSGATCVLAVLRGGGVGPPKGWKAPELVRDTLRDAGVRGDVASATVFTVQDATAQLRALIADADDRLGDWGAPAFRRVVELEYLAGETPSGNEATVEIARYEDGTERTVYLAFDPGEVRVVDLLDWPMAVYEADIPTLNYQDPDDRPYMSPGLLHLTDTDRATGWIELEGGAVASEPWVEPMRITVSLPSGPDGAPVAARGALLWDHGTAGDAYNLVQRPGEDDDGRALAQAASDAGFAVIGRDATLYGARYPLVDEGFTDGSLGFYNLVNLPAFRDNQRQTAIDGHVLRRYVLDRLAADLPEAEIDTAHLRRGGHSLGAVTSNLGLAAEPDAWESAFLVGTGGNFSSYFLDTGLLAGQDPELLTAIFALFGASAPEQVTTEALVGAVLGVPEGAWSAIDRFHPLFTLFQWTMDPSDPLSVARDERLPITVVIAPGDLQTPAYTAEALADALPSSNVVYCEARGDYDPHQCLWREPEGPDLLAAWLAGE
jgi:hypothetical protein